MRNIEGDTRNAIREMRNIEGDTRNAIREMRNIEGDTRNAIREMRNIERDTRNAKGEILNAIREMRYAKCDTRMSPRGLHTMQNLPNMYCYLTISMQINDEFWIISRYLVFVLQTTASRRELAVVVIAHPIECVV